MVSKGLIWGIVIVLVLVVGGWLIFSGGEESRSSLVGKNEDVSLGSEEGSSVGESSTGGAAWMEFELVDVRNDESFKISDFRGKPVLLESFAVWCPTCTRQQKEIKEYHEEVGDSVVSVSLDTDVNEDESKIRSHIEKNGFNWRYVVSPSEMTESLIDEFGSGIVNAPSAPVVLICGDGEFRKLPNGVKKVDELKEAVASCG